MFDAVAHRIPIAEAHCAPAGFRALSPCARRMPEIEAANDPVTDRFDEGYAAGLREGERQVAQLREETTALIAAAQAVQPEASEELAALIGETVDRLVHQIVAQSPVTKDCIMRYAAEAAALITECDAARTMWLHPDDLALFDPEEIGLDVRADRSADRGSVRIDCSAGWIEAGRSLRLDALRNALCAPEVQ